MKAMSLNFGTPALAHDSVSFTGLMVMYAIVCDLYWKPDEETDNDDADE